MGKKKKNTSNQTSKGKDESSSSVPRPQEQDLQRAPQPPPPAASEGNRRGQSGPQPASQPRPQPASQPRPQPASQPRPQPASQPGPHYQQRTPTQQQHIGPPAGSSPPTWVQHWPPPGSQQHHQSGPPPLLSNLTIGEQKHQHVSNPQKQPSTVQKGTPQKSAEQPMTYSQKSHPSQNAPPLAMEKVKQETLPSGETQQRQKPAEPKPALVMGIPTGSLDLLKFPERRQNKDRQSMSGKRIQVDVNHLALKLKNDKIIAYHYDVVFDPEKPKFLLRPVIQEFFRQNFPNRYPIFDGTKNLYSNGPLVPDDRSLTKEVTVFNEESQKDKTFTVAICVVNKIDMSDLTNRQSNPQKALTVVDIALRSLSSFQLSQSGHRFFTPPTGRVVHLGDGIELWHGHFQAASLGWRPFLNFDISNKGFYSALTIEKAIEQVCGADPRQPLQKNHREILDKHLKTLKVEYKIPGQEHSKRTFRVNGVVGSANYEKFKDENGKLWTIAEYYFHQKRYRLQKPDMPCLWVGSSDKKIYIPGELCSIAPGQAYSRKLNEFQIANMVRASTSNTQVRRQNIMESLRHSKLLDKNNPYLREFGISVAGDFERVEARILDAPELEYGNQSVKPQKGVWRACPFTQSKPLNHWGIVCLNDRTRDEELRRLGSMLTQQAESLGMKIDPPKCFNRLEIRGTKGLKALEEFFLNMKGKQQQLVFVVVPDKGDVYARVKTAAEMTAGVLTQCIKARTLSKLNPATVGNILLKVNAKLDGVNHSIGQEVRPKCLKRPVMIVGADVTHPAPGQQGMPSVAAVAASHDPKAFKYNMVWRMQPKGEMINDLENIMREQLTFFYKATSYKPEKILFFRDGVSEGEIQKVMSQEVHAIRRACARMPGDYRPAITFIVVQKRHHTRFFPVDTHDRNIYDQKNFNLPAGTLIDTDIVHPIETEFLLLSHASILGTARPTKYRLVWDDSQFEEDELEQLTYYLCHMFTRCTRSVSYPAPTYYAHLAAFRARNYIDVNPVNLKNLAEEQRQRKMNEDLLATNPMFFV